MKNIFKLRSAVKTIKPESEYYGLTGEVVDFYFSYVDRSWFYRVMFKRASGDSVVTEMKEKELTTAYSKIYYGEENKRLLECVAMDVKKIIFNEKVTVVFWEDGTKTVVKCSETDNYSEYSGFCAAVAKKVFGSATAVKRIFNEKVCRNEK